MWSLPSAVRLPRLHAPKVPDFWNVPIFRIWYSTTYTVVLLCIILALATSPGDLMYQAIKYGQIPQGFAVGGVTVLTAILVILVYSTRIYTNRAVLAAIPKSYLPIEYGEVGRNVRKLIVKEWHRSALVAWDTRPRDTSNEIFDDPRLSTAEDIYEKGRKKSSRLDATAIAITPEQPPWGNIQHAGWSSMSSADLPGLQYWSVILELANLLEAKAVSLAPPDPAFELTPEQQAAGMPSIPDERVVELLRRPAGTGLREYLARLASFRLINPPSLAADFLNHYESARYSTASLTEAQFRKLMDVFGELIAGMTELDPALIVEALQADPNLDFGISSLMPSLDQSSDQGSVRRYQTPMLPSPGRLSPIMLEPSLTPTQRAESGQSDLDEDNFASAESAAAAFVHSNDSVIRRPFKAPD